MERREGQRLWRRPLKQWEGVLFSRSRSAASSSSATMTPWARTSSATSLVSFLNPDSIFMKHHAFSNLSLNTDLSGFFLGLSALQPFASRRRCSRGLYLPLAANFGSCRWGVLLLFPASVLDWCIEVWPSFTKPRCVLKKYDVNNLN
jgi:hypothetical protein